jgi:hypothetical protein
VPGRIDLLTGITGVELDEAWRSRITSAIQGLAVPVIGADDLLRNKEATGRPQDLVDAAWLRSRKR